MTDTPDLSAAAVLALPAGWKTDAIIDHYVMGGVPPQLELLRDAYTVDARAATRLIDHLAARGVFLQIRCWPGKWIVVAHGAAVPHPAGGTCHPMLQETCVEAPTFAHAVALCSLLCVPYLRPA